eukprot:TRINITY_DN20172_c0_g1_i1.p1 TRINITY_DN20172_c0_g1~~TRINITY_DN20172_c0_g1_i1.p1  ORF type:complete len:238 (+),score=42.94 TRINITY_DN20172_c0_g1_i1:62-715(+)
MLDANKAWKPADSGISTIWIASAEGHWQLGSIDGSQNSAINTFITAQSRWTTLRPNFGSYIDASGTFGFNFSTADQCSQLGEAIQRAIDSPPESSYEESYEEESHYEEPYHEPEPEPEPIHEPEPIKPMKVAIKPPKPQAPAKPHQAVEPFQPKAAERPISMASLRKTLPPRNDSDTLPSSKVKSKQLKGFRDGIITGVRGDLRSFRDDLLTAIINA